MHKEDQKATGGPTSLGVTSEAGANPQLRNGMSASNLNKPIYSSSFIVHSESASGYDASADSTAEADPGLSAPSDFIPQQQGMNEGTKITSFDHSILVEEEEDSSIIKLEDLAKLVSHVQPRFKDLDLPKDDHVIVVDDSDEREDDEIHTTENSQKHKLKLEKNKAEAGVALLKSQAFFPNVEQLNELLVKSLKPEFSNILSALDFSSSLPTELKDIPSKFDELTEEVASVQAKLKTLDALPCLLLNVTKALNKFAQVLDSASLKAGDKGKKAFSSEEAEKESTDSDSDDETYVIGFMIIEEEAKAEAATREGEIRKEELMDLLGPEVVNKYYNDKLQYDRYCDKMLNRRAKSRITNCDILTRKGPIILKVYREDDTSKIIPEFKASDLHLAKLGIDLDRPLSEQDPLDRLIDLANKKRKHADDIHDFFRANKRLKSSVQYKDHLAGIVLNKPVLGMILFNSYHRQDFVTIEDFRDFSNTMLYTILEIFFRLHQGPGLDDHARTFNSLLLAEIDKRNLNPLKQIRVIEQLRQ
ncbi:hypothetical protein Tco_0947960 [Tanacetum coccineum]